MQIIIFTLFAVVGGAFAAPSPGNERPYPFHPYAGGFAYAGPGAFAGTGLAQGFLSPFFGFPFFNPYSWPVFTMPTPWYEGPNVCTQTEVRDDSEDMNKWLSDDDSYSMGDMEHNSKSCQGGNYKYMCVESVVTNEGSKKIYTKYQCCPGYKRGYGPGCVKIPDAKGSSDEEATAETTPVQSQSQGPKIMNDQIGYSFVSSGSDSTNIRNTGGA